jgi:hypothetical protein
MDSKYPPSHEWIRLVPSHARRHKLCGCVVTCLGDSEHEPRVTYCPTHAAAPEMIAALKLALRQLRSWHISTKPASKVDVRVQAAINAAEAAIRSAEGT